MAIFDRIRRGRGADAPAGPTPIAEHLLPEVNQRVTVAMGEHVPVASRVEDLGTGELELAMPALALEEGDQVVVTWERDDAWFSMDTRVVSIDDAATVPTLRVATAGRLSRYDERRADARRAVALPIELRVVRARALRTGRDLSTWTTEVSGSAVRFATTAPFAPGDLLEARVRLGDGTDDIVSARVRIIRVDALSGSWRSTCTASFDEILRSDRARLMAFADSAPAAAASEPPTLDGVGGRDEPQELGTFQDAVEWLRSRD